MYRVRHHHHPRHPQIINHKSNESLRKHLCIFVLPVVLNYIPWSECIM